MLTDVAVTGGNTYHYKYDGLGNRVSKTVNSVETRYIVDPLGSRVLAETNESGTITAYYVYGLGLISKITPSDQAYYYHYDGLGSTVAITDSSGVIKNKYAYDAYGKVIDQIEDPGVSNPFKYVGKYGVIDDGNGLLYMRARYYDTAVGRFINKDPIEGALNLYTYVGNNPINYRDPFGLLDPVTPPPAYIECIQPYLDQHLKDIGKSQKEYNKCVDACRSSFRSYQCSLCQFGCTAIYLKSIHKSGAIFQWHQLRCDMLYWH